MNIKNIYNKFTFENFVILLSILVSKSLYYETYGENSLLIILLILVLYKFFTKSKKYYLNKNSLVFYLFAVFAIFINTNAKLSTSLVFFTCITISLFFTNTISLSKFSNVLYEIMKFIMIFSLLRYIVIFLNIPSIIPDFKNIIGETYNNYIFFGVRNFNETIITRFNLIRNNGLWWEPGAYQVFINLAFALGFINNKVSKKDYIIFLLVLKHKYSLSKFYIQSMRDNAI